MLTVLRSCYVLRVQCRLYAHDIAMQKKREKMRKVIKVREMRKKKDERNDAREMSNLRFTTKLAGEYNTKQNQTLTFGYENECAA